MTAKTFKALQLDENDVLVGVVTFQDGATLGERFIDLRPHGGDCDSAPGRYRWNREQRRLDPLEFAARVNDDAGGVSLEAAFNVLLAQLADGGLKLDDRLKLWRVGYQASLEAKNKKKGAQ